MGKVKNKISETLLKIIRRYYLTYRLAVCLSKPYYRLKNLKMRRESYKRIKQINAGEYLDTTRKPNLNVIIIAIDCLRNSHLSCQGYFRETTPFLDSLESRFTSISAAPWTYPSVASILTGLYPHNHKAIITGKVKNFDKLENFQKIRSDILTLPEMLYFLGYRIYFDTAIDTALYPLRARVIPEKYPQPARANDLLNNLKKWISKKREGFFAYVHLGDLHEPLAPPDNFRNFFGVVRSLPNIGNWDFRRYEERNSNVEGFQEYKENRTLLYDNTLRYVDCVIERFHNHLKDAGLLNSTILIVTADHGEEFWEHAEAEVRNFHDPRGYHGVGHGHNVFDEIIKVPLLMSGKVPSKKADHLVSAVDIVPTLLDLLRVGHKMKFDGQNIFEAGDERPLLSEACGYGYEKKALTVGKYKLVYSQDDGIEWLFDLEKDPEEQHPITDKEVTSIYIKKLSHILEQDEKMRVREIIRKKSL